MKIYSTRHPSRSTITLFDVSFVSNPTLVFTDYGSGDFTIEMWLYPKPALKTIEIKSRPFITYDEIKAETAAEKLEAIGIDPKFLDLELSSMIDRFDREIDELREDYDAMYPENTDGI